MVTYNRLAYTKKAIRSVLKQTYKSFRLTIWDNGSSDRTVEYLKGLKDKRIVLQLSPVNFGLAYATDSVFSRSKAKYVGKVDNDTLVPKDWLETMLKAHKTYDFGFIGGFHFRDEEMHDITPKISEYNGQKLWRFKHIGGCSFLIKKKDYDLFGEINGNGIMGLTDYQWKWSDAGKINGYVYPLVKVEHMEDGRSQHCIKNKEHNDYKLNVRNMGIDNNTSVFIQQSKIYLRCDLQ